MKPNITLLTGSISLLLACGATADTIALWTFEPPNAPAPRTSTSITGIQAAIGNGRASGVHNAGATFFSSSTGNGSANALAADHWTAGDYWQFSLATTGYKDITLSYDSAATFDGGTNFNLSYSTDGTTYLPLASNLGVLLNSAGPGGGGGVWNTTTPYTTYTRTVDLSSFAPLNNKGLVLFRLTDTVTGSNAGSSQIDNFLVSGVSLIPEPQLLMWVAPLLLLFRRRK